MQYSFFTEDDLRQTTPFTDRVVCILGSFGASNTVLRKRLQEYGASDIRTAVSRTVHYVLMGENVPEAQLSALHELNFHGYCPRVLHKAEIDDIFSGHYAAYMTPLEFSKTLTLTMQHYESLKLLLQEGVNSLYTEEMYVSPNIATTTLQELYLQLGNLGVYANSYIDDTTNVLLLPDSTILHLQQGAVDDTILYIQNTYNTMRAQNFTLQMIAESDMRAWIKSFAV